MVPGSTFKYGSHLMMAVLSPRASSNLPIEAAAMPLPKLETTPPVTKIYLLKFLTFLCKLVNCIPTLVYPYF